jgi:two-component system response regulator ChvI
MQKKVLIVDDERDILYICKKGLEKSFIVEAFTDPANAIEYFGEHAGEFDIVLTDVRMPKISGFELAREIRNIRRDIVIIFMSAFDIQRDEYASEFPDAYKHVIRKPFSISKLLEVITTVR